jgi:regulator of sigma E protease
MIFSILAFVIILGLLIFVHELGHFLSARFFGVKAEEFGFGFPPRLFGLVYNTKKKKWEIIKGNKDVKRKNTIYSINWIPIGGFVKLLGEDGEGKEDLKNNHNSFVSKKIWQKIIILASGVVMNFFTAAIILAIGFYSGFPGSLDDPSINKNNIQESKIRVLNVVEDTPAEEVGLKPFDNIAKIILEDQTVEINGEKQLVDLINQSKGQEIILEVIRGDDIYRFKVTPRVDYPAEEGSIGFEFSKITIVSYPLGTAIYKGFTGVINMTIGMVRGLASMLYELIFFADTEKAKQVTGIVGIAVYTNTFFEMGFPYLIQLAAMLSINLAIVNILPIPALDGGRILFLIIEKIKGKKVSSKLEGAFHAGGMYFLLGLMLFITIRDIAKFKDKFLVIYEKIVGLFS